MLSIKPRTSLRVRILTAIISALVTIALVWFWATSTEHTRAVPQATTSAAAQSAAMAAPSSPVPR